MMDHAGFEDLVDRHGGEPARWPVAIRADAEALVASSPTARALLAEARQVEAAIRGSFVTPDGAAVDRIAARATRHRQETPARRLAWRAGVGTAAAAVLALGVLVGGLTTPSSTTDMSPDRILASALGSGVAADVD